MNDIELANAIRKWEIETSNDRNRWHRNLVGLAIRQSVGKHWRALARGNPSKGARVARERKAEREGY